MFSLLSRSYKWKKLRIKHLEQENSCRACSSVKNLHVHHIVPVHVDSSKEFEETNLITLCKTCHFVFGHLMDWNSWNQDVIKDSEVYNNKVLNKPNKIKSQFYDKNIVFDFFYGLYNNWLRWNNRP